jgi:hypothetical protein
LADPLGLTAVPFAAYEGDPLQAAWLPDEMIARAWMQYVKNTEIADATTPPPPFDVRIDGNGLSWQAEADLESGLSHFLVERDGKIIAQVPEEAKNRFGRPIFQNLQYSDTPTQPLVSMSFSDSDAAPGETHRYRVIAVNTAGLKSRPSDQVVQRFDR